MFRPDPEILEELGIGRARLDLLETHDAPSKGAGYGFLAAEVQPLQQLVSGPLRENPALTQVEVKSFGERVPEGALYRWDPEPAVLLVQVDAGDILFGHAATAIEDGLVVLDSRQNKVFARVRGSRGEVVIGARHGEIQVLGVEPALSPELDALSKWEAKLPAVLEVPGPGEILGDFPAEGWVMNTVVHNLQSPSAFARAAAVGTLARLWAPPVGLGAEQRRALLARVSAGEGPVARARRWFAAVPEATRAELLELALERADRLRERTELLSAAIAEDPAGARDAALAFAHDRDDLESVAFLFRSIGAPSVLDDALQALDRTVSLHHTIWSAVEGFETDPRLVAVSWQEPDNWWGLLALGI